MNQKEVEAAERYKNGGIVLNKRQLIEEVTMRGFPFTGGALRTYVGKELISPCSTNVGVSNEYSEELVDRICEIIAVNRLGIPLLKINQYFASADRKQYLARYMLSNRRHVEERYEYYRRLLKLTENIEQGCYEELQAAELYLQMME